MADNKNDQLRDDLDRYTDRWRATDRLIEQRVTLLVAAITACVALVAISAPATNTHQTRAAVWCFAAILSFGTFKRLVSGRISIVRSIAILNYIRMKLKEIASDDMKTYHKTLLEADSTLPTMHKWISIQMGAALAAIAMTALCLREVKLWAEELSYPLWHPSGFELWVIPAVLFITCAAYSLYQSTSFSKKLNELHLGY